MRRLLAADASLFGAALKIFARVVDRFYIDGARTAGIGPAKTGALSFQQRFASSLNSHCHLHDIWIDGVFALEPNAQEPRFHFLPPPTHHDIQSVAATVATRVNKMLRRRGLLGDPSHDSNETPTCDDALDACRGVGHGRGRFERLDSRGRSQQELFDDSSVRPNRRKNRSGRSPACWTESTEVHEDGRSPPE